MNVCFSVHTSQPVSLLKLGSGPADHWWGLGLCFSARQPGGADALVQGTHSRPGPGPESLRSVPQSHQGPGFQGPELQPSAPPDLAAGYLRN